MYHDLYFPRQAARTLHDGGMDDFLIIEGADYIGGRVHIVEFDGARIEQGANWAQPGNAPIVQMVLQKGLSCHESNWDSMVIYNATG